jgi:hypothetical protein
VPSVDATGARPRISIARKLAEGQLPSDQSSQIAAAQASSKRGNRLLDVPAILRVISLWLCQIRPRTNRLADITRRFLIVFVKVFICDERYTGELPGPRVEDSGGEHYIDSGFLCPFVSVGSS